MYDIKSKINIVMLTNIFLNFFRKIKLLINRERRFKKQRLTIYEHYFFRFHYYFDYQFFFLSISSINFFTFKS